MTASVSVTEALLRELRVRRLHLQLQVNDLDAVGIALKSGLISDEQAIVKIHEMGINFTTTERREAPEPREGIAA